jgi:hypothetical protein
MKGDSAAGAHYSSSKFVELLGFIIVSLQTGDSKKTPNYF